MSKEAAFDAIIENPHLFREGFGEWLEKAWPIWQRFEQEANAISKHRLHWSANTIIEYMRHESALHDPTSVFKINDKWTSSMARLYDVLHQEQKVFELRTRVGGVVGSISSTRGGAPRNEAAGIPVLPARMVGRH